MVVEMVEERLRSSDDCRRSGCWHVLRRWVGRHGVGDGGFVSYVCRRLRMWLKSCDSSAGVLVEAIRM